MKKNLFVLLLTLTVLFQGQAVAQSGYHSENPDSDLEFQLDHLDLIDIQQIWDMIQGSYPELGFESDKGNKTDRGTTTDSLLSLVHNLSTVEKIKLGIANGIISQMKAKGEYDSRLEGILVMTSQSQAKNHPDESGYVLCLSRYYPKYYNLSDYENLEALISDVVEKTFGVHYERLFSDCVNGDPRHENSLENKHGFRYGITVEDVGENSYKINTVVLFGDREITERGY